MIYAAMVPVSAGSFGNPVMARLAGREHERRGFGNIGRFGQRTRIGFGDAGQSVPVEMQPMTPESVAAIVKLYATVEQIGAQVSHKIDGSAGAWATITQSPGTAVAAVLGTIALPEAGLLVGASQWFVSSKVMEQVTYHLATADEFMQSVIQPIIVQLSRDGTITDSNTGATAPMNVKQGHQIVKLLKDVAQRYADIAALAKDADFGTYVQKSVLNATIAITGIAGQIADAAGNVAGALKNVIDGASAAVGGVGSGLKATSYVLPIAVVGAIGLAAYWFFTKGNGGRALSAAKSFAG